MVINETYDNIIDKLDMYGLSSYHQKKNNYHDSLMEESQEIIYTLYESYIEESKNNKAFSTEWKKLKSDFFKSFKEARKLANNGNYKEAISKIDECEKNLNEGFEQLSKNSKFTLADNLLAMVKYYTLPILLGLISMAFIQLAEHKSKTYLKNNYDRYVRQGALFKMLGLNNDDVNNAITRLYTSEINNDKTIKLLLKLSKNIGAVGIGNAFSKVITYSVEILQSLRSMDNDSNIVNANYNSAKALYEVLIRCIELFKNHYINKMKENN